MAGLGVGPPNVAAGMDPGSLPSCGAKRRPEEGRLFTRCGTRVTLMGIKIKRSRRVNLIKALSWKGGRKQSTHSNWEGIETRGSNTKCSTKGWRLEVGVFWRHFSELKPVEGAWCLFLRVGLARFNIDALRRDVLVPLPRSGDAA